MRIVNRLSTASPSLSVVTTRKPGKRRTRKALSPIVLLSDLIGLAFIAAGFMKVAGIDLLPASFQFQGDWLAFIAIGILVILIAWVKFFRERSREVAR